MRTKAKYFILAATLLGGFQVQAAVTQAQPVLTDNGPVGTVRCFADDAQAGQWVFGHVTKRQAEFQSPRWLRNHYEMIGKPAYFSWGFHCDEPY